MKDKLRVYSFVSPKFNTKQKEFYNLSIKTSSSKFIKKKLLKYFVFLIPFAYFFYALKSKKLFEILELDKKIIKFKDKSENGSVSDRIKYFSKTDQFIKDWSIDKAISNLNDLKAYSNNKYVNYQESDLNDKMSSIGEKNTNLKNPNINNVSKSPLESNIEINFDSRLNKYNK
jgi:hypothetical protein